MRTHAHATFLAHPVIAVGSLVALLSAITCGGDVVVDEDVRGDGGNGDGASGNTGNQGASGNVGNQGATGNQGNTGNVGAQGGQGNAGNQPGVGGTGAAPNGCHSCSGEIQCQQGLRTDPAICRSAFCPGSEELFDAVVECICAECAVECEMSCALMEETNPDCSTCQVSAITGACETQFADCSNDF